MAVSTVAAISLLGVGAIYSARLESAHGLTRKLLYAADMQTGFNAYRAGHLPTVQQRLDRYRLDAVGEDLQTFPWRLLDTLSNAGEQTLYNHSAPTLSVAWSDDGRLVASGGRDYVIRLWDLKRSRSLGELTGHGEDINSLAFSSDGRLLASASDDRTVRVWTVDGSAPVRVLSEFSDLSVYGVAFSPDGGSLVVASEDAKVRVWNTTDWTLAKTWSHHSARVNRVGFSADGSRLVTCSHDGTAQVLEFPSGNVLSVCKATRENDHAVDCAAISPNGRAVATSSIMGRYVAIWTADTGRRETGLIANENTVYNLAFSSDGRSIAGAMRSGGIRVWDATDRHTMHTLLGHDAAVRDVRFSPQDDQLLSCGIDGRVKLWSLGRADRRESHRSATDAVRAVAFQPGGRTFAYCEATGEVVLLDSRTGVPNCGSEMGTLLRGAFWPSVAMDGGWLTRQMPGRAAHPGR